MKSRLHDFKDYEAGYTKQVFQLLPRKLRMTCCVIPLTKLGWQKRQRKNFRNFWKREKQIVLNICVFNVEMFETI